MRLDAEEGCLRQFGRFHMSEELRSVSPVPRFTDKEMNLFILFGIVRPDTHEPGNVDRFTAGNRFPEY